MRKTLLTVAASVAITGVAFAEEVKLGVLIGFTGALESLAEDMASGAELAISEISDSGKLLNGSTVTPIRADTTCSDSAVATASAERLVTSDLVDGIMGADCSGVTGAVLQSVAIPNGMVMISPSATSPGLTTVEDQGLFFRTSPSDARQGEIMAELILERGFKSVAVVYVNNDYGKGLAESFEGPFVAGGGEVTTSLGYESNKGDYSAEVAALSAAGGELLILMCYYDDGGSKILRTAMDTGAFDTFHLADGMISPNVNDDFGAEINGSTGQASGSDSPGNATFQKIAAGAFDPTTPYSAESYDAAALILLAMQSAGSKKPADYKDHVMKVANAPGEEINPGELGKALDILAAGGEVDYVGATAVELIGPGESRGSVAIYEVNDGILDVIEYR